MSLAISRDSWHYRLHVFIRSAWGWQPSPTERWSLCPYFHTTLWGSLLTVLAAIPAGIGWLICKLMRKAYKSGSKGGALAWWANYIDSNGPLSAALDDATDHFSQAPIPTGLTWLLWGLIRLFIGVVVVGVVLFILLGGIRIIPDIPSYLWIAAKHVGWAWFEFAAAIGWLLTGAGIGFVDSVAWLWNDVAVPVFSWVFRPELWLGVLKWTLYIGASLAVPALAGVGITWLMTFKSLAPFWSWLEMKANGYMEARRRRLKTREMRNNMCLIIAPKGMTLQEYMKQLAEEARRERELRDEAELLQENRRRALRQSRTDTVEVIGEAIGAFFGLLGALCVALRNGIKALYSREVWKVDPETNLKTSVTVLGPIGVLWKIIVNFKKGVCPMLEFVDDNDLTDEPPRPPKPRVNLGTSA